MEESTDLLWNRVDHSDVYLFIYLFIAILGFGLRAYILKHSTCPFL
jgi:hypothetical protein